MSTQRERERMRRSESRTLDDLKGGFQELIYQRLEDGPFALQSLDVIPQMGEIMKLVHIGTSSL